MKKLFNLIIMFVLIGSLATVATGCKDESASGGVDAEGFVVLESGLKYKDRVVGEGPTVKSGDRLSMHYEGTLDDGSKFDSSRDKNRPFEFDLGAGQVIKGWDIGVDGMNVGGQRMLVIPYDLAYGEGGIPGLIPAKSTLTFEVEVLEVL
jgi:peptidylprolyl isomerase